MRFGWATPGGFVTPLRTQARTPTPPAAHSQPHPHSCNRSPGRRDRRAHEPGHILRVIRVDDQDRWRPAADQYLSMKAGGSSSTRNAPRGRSRRHMSVSVNSRSWSSGHGHDAAAGMPEASKRRRVPPRYPHRSAASADAVDAMTQSPDFIRIGTIMLHAHPKKWPRPYAMGGARLSRFR